MDTSFQERAERLQRALEAPEGQSWRPREPEYEHPQLLIGELAGVTTGMTSRYGEKQIAIIKDADGTLWNVWLLHHTLADEFHRQQPKVGEHLAIRYEGRVEKPGQAPYEKYRVIVDRHGAAVAWRDAAGNGAETPPEAETEAPPPFAGAAPPPPEPGPEPAQVSAEVDVCSECGFARGRHAQNCSNDIPF